jgi:hypothetical protein
VNFLWSIRVLRPWLFRRWERERRASLELHGRAGPALVAGASAPRFDLPDGQGRVRRSEEWFGRGDAVVWFTNLCDLCADLARVLLAARARGDWTSPIVAVHLPGGRAPSPAAFERATGSGIPVVVDDGRVSRAWTGEAVPDT